MTLHLTYTGIDAGLPLCQIDKQTANARGDGFMHAGYGAPAQYDYGNGTCTGCLDAWYAADLSEARSWTLQVRPANGLLWSVECDPQAAWVLRHRAHVRDRTRWAATAALIPPLDRAHVGVTVHTDDHELELDAAGGVGSVTFAAIVEGLADAHVVPASQPEHVDVTTPTLAALPPAEITPFLAVVITEQSAATHDTPTTVTAADQTGGRQ